METEKSLGRVIVPFFLDRGNMEIYNIKDSYIQFLRQYDTKIIVNVCGKSTEDYCEVVERLASEDVDMLEINISCPNVKEGGIAFGQNPKAAEEITRRGITLEEFLGKA